MSEANGVMEEATYFIIRLYQADTFVQETLKGTLPSLVEVVKNSVQYTAFYNDWNLKCLVPRLWFEVCWAICNKDKPPDQEIDEFFERSNDKLKNFEQLALLAFDLDFIKMLKKEISQARANWPNQPKDWQEIDSTFSETMTTLWRLKTEYFHNREMTYI